jgi:hypothetical protein
MTESQNSHTPSDGPTTGNAVKNFCRSNSDGEHGSQLCVPVEIAIA